MPFLILLVTLFAQASPIPTSGNKVIRWSIDGAGPNLTYYIDSALGSTMATWAVAGFAKWQAVPETYITFSQAASSDAANIWIRGYSQISNVLVPMQAAYNLNSNGSFKSCEVQVNTGAETRNTADYYQQYLQSGMIHEIGHCLGLQHSLALDAVMSYRSNSPLTLAADDRSAISLLYPRDGNSSYPLGCATVKDINKTGPGPTGPSAPAVAQTLFLFLSFVSIWWFKRNQPA